MFDAVDIVVACEVFVIIVVGVDGQFPPFNSDTVSDISFLINCIHEAKVPGLAEFKQSSFLSFAFLLTVVKLLQSSGNTTPPSVLLHAAKSLFLFTHVR